MNLPLHEIFRFGLDMVMVGLVIALFRKILSDSADKMPRSECEARFRIMEEKMNTFTERFIIKLDVLTDLIKDLVDKRHP